jgi:hypothetical protein
MCQNKDKKGLKIDQKGCPGSIGFGESKIEQRELYGEEHRDDQ